MGSFTSGYGLDGAFAAGDSMFSDFTGGMPTGGGGLLGGGGIGLPDISELSIGAPSVGGGLSTATQEATQAPGGLQGLLGDAMSPQNLLGGAGMLLQQQQQAELLKQLGRGGAAAVNVEQAKQQRDVSLGYLQQAQEVDPVLSQQDYEILGMRGARANVADQGYTRATRGKLSGSNYASYLRPIVEAKGQAYTAETARKAQQTQVAGGQIGVEDLYYTDIGTTAGRELEDYLY